MNKTLSIPKMKERWLLSDALKDSDEEALFHWRVFNALVYIHIAYINFFAILHFFKTGILEFAIIFSIGLALTVPTCIGW